MKLVVLLGLTLLAYLPSQSKAMDLRQLNVLNGAKKAFADCNNRQGMHVLDDGHLVCLRGSIDPTIFVNLLKAKSQIKQRPYVVISGAGGYLDSSIYIVRLLNKLGPIPVVGDMCASACAQFLFLMGNERVMLHCADIAIHGGPVPVATTLSGSLSDKAKQESIAGTWRFEQFYQDRHISLDMVTKPPADVQRKLDAGQVVFWPWSINQLRAFGVKGIISENDPDLVVPKDYGKICIRPLPAAPKGPSA